VCADAGRAIFAVDSQQRRVLGYMKDAVGTLGEDEYFLSGLLQELAPPPLPADRLTLQRVLRTLQAIRSGQGDQEQGEDEMPLHCPVIFLGWMAQVPLLWACLDTAMLDQAPVVIVIKWLQRLVD
jgi:hypothetical protein